MSRKKGKGRGASERLQAERPSDVAQKPGGAPNAPAPATPELQPRPTQAPGDKETKPASTVAQEAAKPAANPPAETKVAVPEPKAGKPEAKSEAKAEGKKDSGKKLSYADPGKERSLPEPPHPSFVGGEKVRLKKAQVYSDTTVAAGEVGLLLNTSSQAACWCVTFSKGLGVRVVPEWLLERVGPAPVGAH